MSIFPTQAEAEAQFDLLFATYGLRGRIAGVTRESVRDGFCDLVREFPMFAVERGIRQVINGEWPGHQGDHLPSFPVIWEAIRYQMWRELEVERAQVRRESDRGDLS